MVRESACTGGHHQCAIQSLRQPPKPTRSLREPSVQLRPPVTSNRPIGHHPFGLIFAPGRPWTVIADVKVSPRPVRQAFSPLVPQGQSAASFPPVEARPPSLQKLNYLGF